MRAEMSNLDFTISCIVTFFSKKRTSLPNLNYGMYYPHIIIKGTESWYKLYGSKDVIVNVNIRMYNFDDVQCTVIPSVAYGFVTGMNLQLC